MPNTPVPDWLQNIYDIQAAHRGQNAVVPTAGVRQSVSLPGRCVDTLFYAAEAPGAPLLFAMHGGGFAFGGHALDDAMWSACGRAFGCNVVSINYRKGEENPFPAALEDVYGVIAWYLSHPVGDYDTARAAVMGNSAGANLSAAVCLLATRRRAFSLGMQLLIYPCVDWTRSATEKGYPPAEVPSFDYFQRAYVHEADRANPLASPLMAGDDELGRLPRAAFVFAENDVLRREGTAYRDRLAAAGVPVASHLAAGMAHGYIEFAYSGSFEGFCPEEVKAAAKDGTLEAEKNATTAFLAQQFRDWVHSA